MRSSAAVATSSLVAATAATGSPMKRTLSTQSVCSSWETGRMPNGIGRSRPVSMAWTPSRLAAAAVSIDTMRACGSVLRSSLQYSIRGNARSSAKRVVPVTFATASTLRRALPIMFERWTDGTLERFSRSIFPSFLPLPAIQRFSSGLRDFPPHPRRRQLHRLIDLDVASAATEVAREGLLDFGARGFRIGCEERFGSEQERGRAITALCRAQIGECLLQRVELAALGHRFDGAHATPGTRQAKLQTRKHGRAIEQHGARAALAQFAPMFRAGETQVFAQHFEQRLMWRECHFSQLAVHNQRDLDL